MKKITKRIMALMLSLVMMLGCIPSLINEASAAEKPTELRFTYTDFDFSTNTLSTINETGDVYEGNVNMLYLYKEDNLKYLAIYEDDAYVWFDWVAEEVCDKPTDFFDCAIEQFYFFNDKDIEPIYSIWSNLTEVYANDEKLNTIAQEDLIDEDYDGDLTEVPLGYYINEDESECVVQIPFFSEPTVIDTEINISTYDQLATGQDIDSTCLISLSKALTPTGTISNVKWYADGVQTAPGDKFQSGKDYAVTFNWDCKVQDVELTKLVDGKTDIFSLKSVDSLMGYGDSYSTFGYNENASSTSFGWRDLTEGSSTKFVSLKVPKESLYTGLDLFYFYKDPTSGTISKVSGLELFQRDGALLNNIYVGTSEEDCYKLDLNTVIVIDDTGSSVDTINETTALVDRYEYSLSPTYTSPVEIDPIEYVVRLDGKSLCNTTRSDDNSYPYNPGFFKLSNYNKTLTFPLHYTLYADNTDLSYTLDPVKAGDTSLTINIEGDDIPAMYEVVLLRGNVPLDFLLKQPTLLLFGMKGMYCGEPDILEGKIVADSWVSFLGECELAFEPADYTLLILPIMDVSNIEGSGSDLGARVIHFTPTGSFDSSVKLNGMQLESSIKTWSDSLAPFFLDIELKPSGYDQVGICCVDEYNLLDGDDNFEKTTKLDMTLFFMTMSEVKNLTLKKGTNSDYQEITLSKNPDLDLFEGNPAIDTSGYRDKVERATSNGFLSDPLKEQIIDYYNDFTNCYNSIYFKDLGFYGTVVRVTFDFSDKPITNVCLTGRGNLEKGVAVNLQTLKYVEDDGVKYKSNDEKGGWYTDSECVTPAETIETGTKYYKKIRVSANEGYRFDTISTVQVTNGEFVSVTPNGDALDVIVSAQIVENTSSGSKKYKATDSKDTAEKITGSGKKGSTRTIVPEEGRKVASVKVVDKNGNEVPVTMNEDGTYSFEQPASNVDVLVSYKNREITLNIGSTEASVDGERETLDVSPVIRNDRTMLPIRFVAENLGAKVEWSEKNPNYVVITRGDTKIEITLGSDIMKVNGKNAKLDSVAFAENDRTYLPVRAVSEALNAIVEWHENEPSIVRIYEQQ